MFVKEFRPLNRSRGSTSFKFEVCQFVYLDVIVFLSNVIKHKVATFVLSGLVTWISYTLFIIILCFYGPGRLGGTLVL